MPLFSLFHFSVMPNKFPSNRYFMNFLFHPNVSLRRWNQIWLLQHRGALRNDQIILKLDWSFWCFHWQSLLVTKSWKKKHFTTRLSEKKLLFCMEIILHKINFNLKSVICAAWITQKQFAVESRINIAWVISIYCTLPHVHLLLQLSGSEWRGPLCRI